MRICVTGGAGFIGSNFVDRAIDAGYKVRVVDNFRTGRREHVHPKVELHEGSILDQEVLLRAFDGCEWVVHFAANADVRHGPERTFFDIEQNTLGTAKVLDAMRVTGVSRIFFASTASVYGNYQADMIREDAPFPIQNSLYGASKVAGEGLVAAYAEAFGFTSVIGRWVQIIGERYLHGHVIDFVRKLQRDPSVLHILGDGKQAKSGLYVGDLARAIPITMAQHADDPGTHVYNIGTEDTFTVDESADLISARMKATPRYVYSGRTNGGWIGDSPRVLLDASKMRGLGWTPTMSIPEAITRTVDWLLSEKCTFL